MPEDLKRKLRVQAHKKGFMGERSDEYVYGALNNMGLMRGNKTTAKGEALDNAKALARKRGRHA